MRLLPHTALLALLALPAAAQPAPVVVELFTSQGCSSCPPADALLTELARTDAGLLPLDLHVTNWDRLGWRDPYSLPAATGRQRDYSARLGLEGVYTPQVVVAGLYQAVGSDRAAVRAAIARARAEAPAAVPLAVAAVGAGLRLHAAAGTGTGTLWLVGYDPRHSTAVAAGENGGRTLQETNVVRALVRAGDWSGAALDAQAPRPAGERVALLLQGADGRILSAAVLP
jgi:hypothetical protein